MKAAPTGASWTASRKCGECLFTSERVQAVQSKTFSPSESVLVESSRFMLLTIPVSALLPMSDAALRSALGLFWRRPAVRIRQPTHVSGAVIAPFMSGFFLRMSGFKINTPNMHYKEIKMKWSPLNFTVVCLNWQTRRSSSLTCRPVFNDKHPCLFLLGWDVQLLWMFMWRRSE